MPGLSHWLGPRWQAFGRPGALTLLVALVLSVPAPAQGPAGETLYNGIVLPADWPPHPAAYPAHAPTPPYLTAPPAVIPIDVGRQLFVDDFLVESTTMSRTFHQPVYHPSNPLVFPDRPWEGGYALAYSDGVFYDPSDQLFKMWYMAGELRSHTSLAVSTNGITWDKPVFDVLPGTNVVIPNTGRDSNSVWLDHYETDPARRFKAGWWYGGMQLASSPDGIHWGPREYSSGTTGDRSTFFYNPFRRKWVFSLRSADGTSPELIETRRYGRVRRYAEGATLVEAAQSWPGYLGEGTLVGLPKWLSADVNDLPTRHPHFNPQLYNVDAAAYESLIVGYFTILTADTAADRPKINEVSLGYSRDGFHFSRPDRRPFFPVSEDPGAWNYGNVQSTAGGGIVVGDQIYFYMTGRTLDRASTGLAVLRRDGFASMDAAQSTATLVTRPVRFSGRHLFVNADLTGGEVCAEVLNQSGQVIAPFTLANCVPVTAGGTAQRITWAGAADLSALRGQAVKFRFTLRQGRLYAFWVSPDTSGASYGYLSAGGPGLPGGIDTVGNGASPNNALPTVIITAPATGGTFPSSADVTLAAEAADGDGSVTLVQFYANGTLIGVDEAPPYATTWPNVATGVYSLTARAFDNLGGHGVSAPVTITVGFPTNARPTVALTSPGAGSVFDLAEPIALTADAADANGFVTEVRFFVDSQLIGTDATSPYEVTWTTALGGSHSLTAVAIDDLGAATTSAAVTVSVLSGGAAVNVALAAHGATATASSTYTTAYPAGAAIDGRRSGATRGQSGTWEDSGEALPDWLQVNFVAPYAIDEVHVFSMQEGWWAPVDPTPVLASYLAAEDFEIQYWSGAAWVAVPGGRVVGNTQVWRQVRFAPVTTSAIRIVVTKIAGGRTRLAEVEVYRAGGGDTAPSIALQPPDGGPFTAPATIQFEATASDLDGSVSRVAFFAGTQPIGTDDTAPYEVLWPAVASGTYAVTAVATDDAGNSTTSLPVTVTVSEPPPPNAPPLVSLTAPTAGSAFTQGDAVALRAAASDPGGSVARVDFFVGAQLIASDATSPYEATWTAGAVGPHSITAVAVDTLNAATTATAVPVTVAAAPRVNVALADNGATATASSTYTTAYPARAAIDGRRSGAVRGQLGTWEDAATEGPDWFQVTFAAPAAIDQVHVVSMQEGWWAPVEPTPTLTSYLAAEDFEVQSWNGADWVAVPGGQVVGNTLVWRQVTFAPVTTTALRIVITKVAGGRARLAEFEAWTAVANVSPPAATLTAAPATIAPGGSATLSWTTADAASVAVTPGVGPVAATGATDVSPTVTTTYTLTATNGGGTTTRTAVVTVQAPPPNAPPLVSLTAPTAGSAFTQGDAVALRAAASDPGGSVARVDFFVGAQLIASDATSPYEATWTAGAVGPHSITAVAVDTLNAATTATAVPVTVAAAPRVNVALADNGATATASSTYTTAYPARAAIDGRRSGAVRGQLGTWEDATGGVPDWFQVSFAAPAIIDQVNVFSIQERHATPVEPTPTLTSYLAAEDFEVQSWNGAAWVAVPGGQVVGNTLVWRQVNFAPVTTTAIRIVVTKVAGGYTRLTEVEAWTAAGVP
ncbi:MAG: Ig-like domain-containing protein [Vicinamibacterales bacterium]